MYAHFKKQFVKIVKISISYKICFIRHHIFGIDFTDLSTNCGGPKKKYTYMYTHIYTYVSKYIYTYIQKYINLPRHHQLPGYNLSTVFITQHLTCCNGKYIYIYIHIYIHRYIHLYVHLCIHKYITLP